MTGLYVIVSAKAQRHLSKRSLGYQGYQLPDGWAYVRGANPSDDLGAVDGDLVRMRPQWVSDVGSVFTDRSAVFFYVMMTHGEGVMDAIARGRALPFLSRMDYAIGIDVEQRKAAAF